MRHPVVAGALQAMTTHTSRETLKTMEEIWDELKNWEQVQLCKMGESHYAIFDRSYISDIRLTHRWKISESLFREAQRTIETMP